MKAMTVSLYAAILALIFIGLSLNVIHSRKKLGISLGDGQQTDIIRRVRAQGNFAEYAPFFVLLLALAEYGGLPVYLVHLFGVVFIAGRLLHAYSLLKAENYKDGHLQGTPTWRIAGMMMTFAVLGLLAMTLIMQYLMLIL
jgi:uncharacterized protein